MALSLCYRVKKPRRRITKTNPYISICVKAFPGYTSLITFIEHPLLFGLREEQSFRIKGRVSRRYRMRKLQYILFHDNNISSPKWFGCGTKFAKDAYAPFFTIFRDTFHLSSRSCDKFGLFYSCVSYHTKMIHVAWVEMLAQFLNVTRIDILLYDVILGSWISVRIICWFARGRTRFWLILLIKLCNLKKYTFRKKLLMITSRDLF